MGAGSDWFSADRFATAPEKEPSFLALFINIYVREVFFKKMEVFSKKDAQIFAGSKKVATFASAFEKYRFLQISRGFTIKELEAGL